MTINPSQGPNLTRLDTFDETKGFVKTAQNQGAPILDTDLNDSQDYIRWSVNQQIKALEGRRENAVGPHEFMVRPVTRDTAATLMGVHQRNADNFAITLGRLATRLGLVDARSLSQSSLFDFVVFDYQRLVDSGVEDAKDHVFGNFMFKGKVTAAGAGLDLKVIDENKNFKTDHFLLGFNPAVEKAVIPGSTGAVGSTYDAASPAAVVDSLEVTFEEDACRIIFLTGANAGEEKVLTGLDSSTELRWAGALPSVLAEGDEYVIVPNNTFEQHRNAYDAASTIDESSWRSLTGIGALLSWVHVWYEDYSADEDTDIPDPTLGLETTHRVGLRWCVRSTIVRISDLGDAGRYYPSPVHLYNLLTNKTTGTAKYPFFDHAAAGDRYGDAGSLEDGSDLVQSFHTQSAGGAFIARGYDESPFSASSGMTRQHFYKGVWGGIPDPLFALLQVVFEGFLSDETQFTFSPLLLHAAPRKISGTPAAESLIAFWYPNIQSGNPGVLTPRLNFEDTDGYEDSLYAVPIRRLSLPDVDSSDLQRARGMSWMSPIWRDDTLLGTDSGVGLAFWSESFESRSGLLVESDSSFGIPLLFESVSHHFGFLDMMVLGMSGLGNAIGNRHPKSPFGGGTHPIPTNRLFVEDSTAKDTLFQSGQSNRVFIGDASSILNPDLRLQGAVAPIDPLAGTVAPDAPRSESGWDGGEWITGPGQYLLKRTGEIIDTSDGKGWGFHLHSDSDFEPDGNPFLDFSPRAWDEGFAQAKMLADSLMFRKLAIKTSAFKEADLFTIDVPAPTVVSEPEGFDSFPDDPFGSKLRDWKDKVGYGFCSIGALQDTSMWGNYDDTGEPDPYTVSHTAYDSVGADDTGTLPTPFKGFADAHPDIPAEIIQGGSTAIERWLYDFGGLDGIEGWVKMDAARGAWGRWQTFPDNDAGGGFQTDTTFEMLDQWSNRCTAMRLRYHVGDYYPGPVDDKGVITNALVDTLNLFVRIEPLPLVHWMTLPKHQHSILEGSIGLLHAFESMDRLNLATGSGDSSHLLVGETPKVVASSPALDPGTIDIGDDDPLNLPFAYEHQLFVHWYHPLMEEMKAPWPMPTPYSQKTGHTGNQYTAYYKFGERSMIVPAIGWKKDEGVLGGDTILVETPEDGTFMENLRNDPDPGGDGTTDSFTESRGNHWATSADNSAGNLVTIGGVGLTITDRMRSFPFIPRDDTTDDFSTDGYPGPVMIPAMRAFAQEDNQGDNTKYSAHGVGVFFENTTSAQLTALSLDDEEHYFPTIDQDGYTDEGIGSSWGTWDIWKLPVLRAPIRTDTVAKIVDLVVTSFGVNYTSLTSASNEGKADELGDWPLPAAADVDSDTLFVGDVGTAVMLDSSAKVIRTFFSHPLALGVPSRVNVGRPTHVGDSRDAGPSVIVQDYFEYCDWERDQAYQGDAAGFLPIMNTWIALKHQGLQQKLLWNSSFRILHSRPGGGFIASDGASGPRIVSSESLSLTELFLVRDREEGAASPWPTTPNGPEDKAYIHLESIHPAAEGGAGTFQQHPNNPYVKHLYPMICDTIGGTSESAPASSDPLYDESIVQGHKIGPAEWLLDAFKTGVGGDSFVGDPYDYAYSKYTADLSAGPNYCPKRDRQVDNSGIEIDLISELRYVRRNQAAHGVNNVGTFGKDLADMMPSVGEIAAPGDHEIVFVLYTGKYGQKMVDDTVPDGYNPPVAGCHVVASVEVNRPNEKVDSAAPGSGEHYGETREVWNILGHS
jgi:hypothetical protein